MGANRGRIAGRLGVVASVATAAATLGATQVAAQATPPALNVCSGVSVSLPVLNQVPAVGAGAIGALPVLGGVGLTVNGAPITAALNTVVGNVNANLTNALSGQPLSVSALDANGNLVSLPSGNCSLAVTNPNGITLGGGQIDGLGGNGNPLASAGAPSAIAIGNGATTTTGVANAVALGAGANATTAGSVALGSGSVANRLNSGSEMFSGPVTGLDPALGIVSVGAAGSPRQIANVAGGTADTDATNVRQLRAVGSNLATALGGGAAFSPTTGAFTAPGYTIRGTLYNNVGGALAALDTAIGAGGGGNDPIAGRSTDGTTFPAAQGDNSVAGGYQAVSAGTASTSLGDSAAAMGQGSTSVGTNSQAMALNTTAIGMAAVANFEGSTAIGAGARAIADPTTAVGYNATASGNDAVVVGAFSNATGDFSAAIGAYATASGINATAIGHSATASGAGATAIGQTATASADGSVALGYGSVANRYNAANEAFTGAALRTTLGTVSVGSAGNERQITNVAGGTADTDAVNVRQLRTVGTNLTSSLGGGAAFDGAGIYTAPTYTVAGAAYRDVGSAIGALEATGVKYDTDPATGARTNTITLAGGDPNTPVLIRNVAAGIAPTDAANVGQVRAAVQESKTYTDQQIANSLGNVQSLARLQQDVRQVRREARQAAAIGLATGSLRYDSTPGKISLAAGGGGWQGEGAAAFGIGYTTPDGFARMNLSASTSDGKWGVGGGLSITLN